MALTEQVSDEAMVTDLAQRRHAASIQTAALQGRNEQAARAARTPRQPQGRAAAKAKAEREAKRWVRPIHTWHITSDFGARWGTPHDGIDLGASTGTPVYAMSKGTVIGSFYDSSFGNKVEIKYWDGSISWYGHLSKRIAQKGDTVQPGELVGLVGNTGHSFGSHLHFEMQKTTAKDTPDRPARLAQAARARLTPQAPRRRPGGSELLERREAQHEPLDPELAAEVDLGLRLVALTQGAHHRAEAVAVVGDPVAGRERDDRPVAG